MSTTSDVILNVQFTGDVEFQQDFDAVTNATSPGDIEPVALTTGANTITVPSGATGVAIILPLLNTVQVILKKIAGDTGIDLALIGFNFISLNGVTSIVLNAASSVSVRIIFT